MDALQPILEKDPAVNPPCIVTAGSSLSVENEVGNDPEKGTRHLSCPTPLLHQSLAPVSRKGRRVNSGQINFFGNQKNIIRK